MFTKPTLLVNQSKVEHNINRMLKKAYRCNITFRPHFKTHQSTEIAELFRNRDVNKITVSSVSMAQYFVNHGWNDITIAFPVNLLEVDKINALSKITTLNLLVDSVYSTTTLADKISNNVGLFIEIDNGYHRSGLLPEQFEVIDDIVNICNKSDKLKFKGFLTHAGNTYSSKGKEEILSIMNDAKTKLHLLKQNYITRSPGIIVSYGDTPSCSIADDLSGFDEIRPGNFVYYDVMQYHLGSCKLDDIAVAVACPVVSVYPERNELIIYGGAVHLSKEFIAADNDFKLFGYIVKLQSNGWGDPIAGAYVSSISQEHGIIKVQPPEITKFKPGDVIGVLPIHSCLTANLLKENMVII